MEAATPACVRAAHYQSTTITRLHACLRATHAALLRAACKAHRANRERACGVMPLRTLHCNCRAATLPSRAPWCLPGLSFGPHHSSHLHSRRLYPMSSLDSPPPTRGYTNVSSALCGQVAPLIRHRGLRPSHVRCVIPRWRMIA